MKVVHIISGLEGGGAEMMLFKLLQVWDRRRDDVEVISLTDRGVIGEKIERIGVRVSTLNMPRGRPSLGGIVRLTGRLRRLPPAIVHCWMYHGNLIGGLSARFAGQRAVIWGIRSSNLDEIGNRRSTRWTVKAGAILSSSLPQKIVSCSEVALKIHADLGYDAGRMTVIPNGFDTSRFKPDEVARSEVRAELNLRNDVLLIGFVARFDPQKDHRGFIDAARHLIASGIDAHFMLCGTGIDQCNTTLVQWIAEAGLLERFHLLGRRDDIPRLTAALDLAACSSSFGEAFPNILGEAMACGIPCVATDVGDSAYIIGDTGFVVPPSAPELLAKAWSRMLTIDASTRRELGEAARRRVAEKFELGAIATRFAQLYCEMSPSGENRQLVATSEEGLRRQL
jgi:glycosyltransferase involved in cell wall biosynthesis